MGVCCAEARLEEMQTGSPQHRCRRDDRAPRMQTGSLQHEAVGMTAPPGCHASRMPRFQMTVLAGLELMVFCEIIKKRLNHASIVSFDILNKKT